MSSHMWWGIWINISSGDGELPDRTKPLPNPMLTDSKLGPYRLGSVNLDHFTYNISQENAFENTLCKWGPLI